MVTATLQQSEDACEPAQTTPLLSLLTALSRDVSWPTCPQENAASSVQDCKQERPVLQTHLHNRSQKMQPENALTALHSLLLSGSVNISPRSSRRRCFRDNGSGETHHSYLHVATSITNSHASRLLDRRTQKESSLAGAFLILRQAERVHHANWHRSALAGHMPWE